MAACLAHIVRTLQFTAIRAFLKGSNGERVVAPTHVTPRRRGFSLWDGHCGTLTLIFDHEKTRLSVELVATQTRVLATNPLDVAREPPPIRNSAMVATPSTAWQKAKNNKGRSKSMILPVTLTAAGLAALINLWLAIRVGQVRTREKVSIGDGGNEAVIARMRAHANFVEYTPIVVLLIGAIELARGAGAGNWLWYVMILFMAGRVVHAFGMDGFKPGRPVGTIITMLTLVGLGAYAIAIPYLSDGQISTPTQAELTTAEEVPVG
jgi:uncharacterized protein